MIRDNDNEFAKLNNDSAVRPKKRIFAISLLIILSILLILQGCNTEQNKMDIAVKKVRNLFQAGIKVEEGKSSKIKDSTDQEQINEALKAIGEIDTKDGRRSEESGVVFSLQSAIIVAQAQLNKREGTGGFSENDIQDEQKEQKEQFQPDDDDVVWEHNKLKNRDILEKFMNSAGENGKNNGIGIRVVKDEEEKGLIIYDLKSVYSKYADEGWIDVTPDLSHYYPPEDETQNVFNMSQQCSYISKDIEFGYYNLNECYTHLEYPLLPINNDN